MVVLTSFTQPTDGIRHRQNNTTVYVNDNNLGKGTLFIAESRLAWVSDSGNGFSIEYPHISLHAVSRDLSGFPHECLFLMLDTAVGEDEINNGNGDSDDGNENGSDEQSTEIRLVPDDRGMLEAMFHAMNACQALHPDPEDSFSDEDFFEDADDEIPMEETDHRMAGLRIESMDGRLHIGMAEGTVEDTAEDRVEDMVGDMEEGTLGTLGEGRVVGRAGGIWGDREVGRVGGILGAGMEGGMAGDTWGDRVAGRVGGTLGTLGVGRVEDRAGGTVAADICTLGAGRVAGREGDTWVGREAGREVDTWGGRVVGREGGTWVGREAGRVVDTLAADRGEDIWAAPDTAQGDRSYPAECNGHRGRTAPLPAAHSPQMDLEEDIHFDDAEN